MKIIILTLEFMISIDGLTLGKDKLGAGCSENPPA